MSFNTALTTEQYALLRSGSSASDYLLTLCSNSIVLSGTISTNLSLQTTWAEFNYGILSGDPDDVKPDMALLIGTTSSIFDARYRGRTRLDYATGDVATATTVYCNESSENFNSDVFYWILNTFDVNYKLSRPVGTPTLEYVDYNTPYAGPEPMVLGLRTAYVSWVDTVTGKYRVAFDVSNSRATAPGETIDSYQFALRTGFYTVVSGSLASAVVTVDFEPGEQWGQLIIVDTAGISKTRNFFVKAHDADNLPDIYFDDPSISADLRSGWSMPIGAFAGVDNVLNNTFAVVWRANELYGGAAGQLYPDNNIAFLGWFQREDDTAQGTVESSVTEDAKFEFTGVLPRMARLTAQKLGITLSATPTEWGQLASLTPWRAICHILSRYSTVANLCDVDFDSWDDTYLFPDISSQGGNLQAAVSEIAWQINALLESAPDGRIAFNRSAEFLTQAERDALTVVAEFTTIDALKVVKSLEQNNSVGKDDGDAAVYNAINAGITVFSSRAPGIAQGEAQGSDTLPAQILASTTFASVALAEFKQRMGDKLTAINNSEVLVVSHPDGYTPIFIPSKAQLFSFVLDNLTANGVNRINYDASIYWTLEGFQFNHKNQDGTTTPQSTYRRLLPPGSPGDDTTQVPVNSIINPLPDLGLPAFDFELPALGIPDGGVALTDINPLQLAAPPDAVLNTKGQVMVVKSDNQAFVLKNFINLTTPPSNDITPDLGDYIIKQVLFDPAYTPQTVPVYVLTNDTSEQTTIVQYADNAALLQPNYTNSGGLSGEYTTIRATRNAALMYASNIDVGVTPAIQDFEFSPSGAFGKPFNDVPLMYDNVSGTVLIGGAVHVSGTGWRSHSITLSVDPYVAVQCMVLELRFNGVYTFGNVDVHYTLNPVGSTGTAAFIGAYQNTDESWTFTGSGIANNVPQGDYTSFQDRGFNPTRGFLFMLEDYYGDMLKFNSLVITKIVFHDVTFVSPLATNTAAVAIATDKTSFAPSFIGDPPAAQGSMDVQRSGTVSYATVADGVVKADTIGGAFSPFIDTIGATAVAIVIPYYRFGSTTSVQTAVTDPDVLIALDQPDSDLGTLYKVSGAGVKTDITPVSGMTFSSPNCATMSFGTYLAVIGTVGGIKKLYVSYNTGSSWTLIETLSDPAEFVRSRRNDDSALQGGGQLYLNNAGEMQYSSQWAANGMSDKNMPVTDLNGFDTLG